MLRVFIATQNKDKYKVVFDQLQHTGIGSTFSSIFDLDAFTNIEETATTIEERSRQKALHAVEELSKKKLTHEYDLLVAVDDGICLQKGTIPDPNLKVATKKILVGDLLSPGDEISIHHALTFVIVSSRKVLQCFTHEEYIYLGPTHTPFEEGRNPLGNVLRFKHDTRPAYELTSQDILNHYLRSSENELKKIKEFLEALFHEDGD